MKKLSLLQKVLTVVACCLCLVMIGAGVHAVWFYHTATAPEPPEDLSQYDVVFTGSISILDEPYDVVLKGKNGSFHVDAGNIKNVMDGTYTFTEGQGWSFRFEDSLGTNVRSMYDAGSKTSSFVYHLDLGSRGAGNLLLSREEKDFTPAGEQWEQLPMFQGTAYWFGGAVMADAVASFDGDGNFRVFCTGQEINEITGTFEKVEGHYVLTQADGDTVTSYTNPETGLESLSIMVHRPALEAYGAADTEAVLTQSVLELD